MAHDASFYFRNGKAWPERGLMRPGFYRGNDGAFYRQGSDDLVLRPARGRTDAERFADVARALRNAGYAVPLAAVGGADA